MKRLSSIRGRVFLLLLLAAGLLARPALAAEPTRQLPTPDVALYAAEPVPMQPVDCAQCHGGQFTDLKEAGGLHRFACQECHERFHAYNPRLNNYDALMPKCDSCHGLPHGDKQAACLECHKNPHAPRQVPSVERLAQACGDCHAGPAGEIVKYPSAHTEQGCQGCHSEGHGYIPSCFECHEGHYEGQALASCAECHSRVHAPLEIGFKPDTEIRSCSGCHDGVYSKWQATPSKHGGVLCSMCHQEHGKIPACQDCHGEPHIKQQLAMFPNCLSCHIDVHDLPVKKK